MRADEILTSVSNDAGAHLHTSHVEQYLCIHCHSACLAICTPARLPACLPVSNQSSFRRLASPAHTFSFLSTADHLKHRISAASRGAALGTSPLHSSVLVHFHSSPTPNQSRDPFDLRSAGSVRTRRLHHHHRHPSHQSPRLSPPPTPAPCAYTAFCSGSLRCRTSIQTVERLLGLGRPH